MTLTWDEIKKRSEHKVGNITTYCFDCYLNFEMIGMSCDKHAKNQSEQDERAKRYDAKMRPFLLQPSKPFRMTLDNLETRTSNHLELSPKSPLGSTD